MKKYYKSLDYVLLALAAVKKGEHVTAAKNLVLAAEEDDADEMVEDVNQSQEGDDEDTAEEEISAALTSLTSKKKVRASDDNTDLEDVEGEAGGEREAVEDEVVARMEARRIRAQANLKRMRGK